MSDMRPGGAAQLLRVAQALTLKQKLSLLVATALVVAMIWGIVGLAGRQDLEVLYANLDPSDAAEIHESLRSSKIPNELESGGRTIRVPGNRVDELRLSFASEGLPRGGGAGFEIFDQTSFSASEFVQEVNLKRAMERELQRTIESLDVVGGARVHLVMPKETLFVSEPREAKASVVVDLRQGRRLSVSEVGAITHLVASAVDGLRPEKVSVVDTQGAMLSNGEDDDSDVALSARQGEMKGDLERSLQTKIVSLLEPMVGAGKVKAHAEADLDFERITSTEELYDPTSAAVRSETKLKQKSTQESFQGAAGTASNLPTGSGGAQSGPVVLDEMTDTTTQFEVNRTVRSVVTPAGQIRRLSVAVVVDDAPADGDGAEGAGGAASRPRTDEEMAKITDLVKAAMGFDDGRGDTLQVENIAFEPLVPTLDEQPAADPARRWFWLQVIKWPSILVAGLLVFFLMVRPALRSLSEAVTTAGELRGGADHLLTGGSAGELGEGLGAARRSEVLRRRLITLVNEEPEGAGEVAKSWLSQGSPRS